MSRGYVENTKPSTWTRRGFTEYEAYELARISPAGMRAPYIRAMIEERQQLHYHAASGKELLENKFYGKPVMV